MFRQKANMISQVTCNSPSMNSVQIDIRFSRKKAP